MGSPAHTMLQRALPPGVSDDGCFHGGIHGIPTQDMRAVRVGRLDLTPEVHHQRQ